MYPRLRRQQTLPAALAMALVSLVACSPPPEPSASLDSATADQPGEVAASSDATADQPGEVAASSDATADQPGEVAASSEEADREAGVHAAADALLDELSTANVAAFVTAAAADGDERWVPWLVDLLRLDTSLATSNQISAALAEITGIAAESRIPDMIAYGSWSASRGLDGGDGYRAFKVGLYARIDDRFGPLLESVQDQALLAAVQWGGVPVGGIPELNDPGRVPAADADWMIDDEVVLGVLIGDEAVAYPLRILARHELANDTVGGAAIAVVYCTLCRSAMVFDRSVDGRTLSFLTSGLLSNSNKVMVDVETETLWSHLLGLGIGGPLAGAELTVRAVNHMRWNDWLAEHPDTEVLAIPDPIFFEDPERAPISYDYTPGEAYRSYYENPDVWFPVIDTPDVWPLKTEVIGLEVDGDAVAVPVERLNELGEDLIVEVGGETLRIEPTGVGARVFDERGERVIAEQSFWFAWFAHHPDTRTLTDF